MAAALLRVSRGARSFIFSERPAVLGRTIHTGVWWDFGTCKIPEGGDAFSIVGNIIRALAKCNYNAPITFNAYGGLHQFASPVIQDLEELSKRGYIKLADIPYSRHENRVSKLILNGLWYWSKEHPAPANCLFISGDEYLSFALHQLGMSGYGILLAKPQARNGSGAAMEAAAKTLWQWTTLLAGGPPERTSQ